MNWKLFLILVPLLLLSTSCGDEDDVKLEAFNPEVFAYDIGDEFEVNAAVRIKGFEFRGEEGNYNSSISFEADLVRPDGEKESAVVSKSEDLNFDEKVGDTGIDVQFNLDSSYAAGKYTLVLHLTDNFSGRTALISADFNLSK